MKSEKTKRPGRARAPRISVAGPIRLAGVEPRSTSAVPLVARSIFGHAPELNRPRLVLFVGTAANCYAPVAALWFSALASESKATIVLAYADSAPRLTPELAAAVAENGLDSRRLIARTLTPELLAAADLVVTLSSGRQPRLKLPKITRRKEHWTIPAPAAASSTAKSRAVRVTAGKKRSARGASKLSLDAKLDARQVRDALRARVAMLVFSEGWGRHEISREDARVTSAKPTHLSVASEPSVSFAGRGGASGLSFVPETPTTPAWFLHRSPTAPSLR